jgi:transcriptional regulator with XRE-family HTH domain
MSSFKPDSAFIKRLRECAEKAGGKRALAQKTGISEPQIYRYLAGINDITLTRLKAIAKATKTDLGWLVGKE